MAKYFTGSPRRTSLAFLISLTLHACLVLGWLGMAPVGRISGLAGIATEVDEPADQPDFTIAMGERSASHTVRVEPLRPRETPRLLDLGQWSENPPPSPPTPEILPAAKVGNMDDPDQASPAPSAGGKPLHGKPRAGQIIAYVLDCSSSMGSDGQLRAACRVLRASIEQLNPDCRFQIVAYNSNARALFHRPQPATPENRARADHWLGELAAEGGSVHLAGLREAFWQQPDHVYLLTDEEDFTARDYQNLRKILRKGLSLHAVIFNSPSGPGDRALKEICEGSGGCVVFRPIRD